MKFLCLAYGSEEDWNRLSREERDALLAQDEVVRLVEDTPCARAGGAIETRPILQLHEPGPGSAG